MTLQRIPTLYDGTVQYSQITELDGVSYKLLFSYNSRDAHWYLDLSLESDVAIIGCDGMKLVQGSNVLRRVYDINRPPGNISILSTLETEPGLYDLGASSLLVYEPIADVV